MVFGIIFTIILIAAILIFGSGIINDLIHIIEESQVSGSIDNLQKKVSYIHSNADGSGAEFILSFPIHYKLCFFNSSNPESKFYSDKSRTWDPDQTTKLRINQSSFNSWCYEGSDNAGGHGYAFSYLDISTEKNFCASGGSKIYLVNKGGMVEIHL